MVAKTKWKLSSEKYNQQIFDRIQIFFKFWILISECFTLNCHASQFTINNFCLGFLPDPPSQIQVPCNTLPLLPTVMGVLFLHLHAHKTREHFPAVPAPLHVSLLIQRMGLVYNQIQIQASYCGCWDLRNVQVQGLVLEVWMLEGSLWGMEGPLRLGALEVV